MTPAAGGATLFSVVIGSKGGRAATLGNGYPTAPAMSPELAQPSAVWRRVEIGWFDSNLLHCGWAFEIMTKEQPHDRQAEQI